MGRSGAARDVAAADVEHDDKARKAILSWIGQLEHASCTLAVLETTGGYEALLVKLLHNHNFALAVTNPRQVRDFAKGIGRDAKTDAIDAEVLSVFSKVVKLAPQAAKSDE